MSAEKRHLANIDARDISILVLPDKEKTLDEEKTKAEGDKGEAEHKCEEELPHNLPCVEEQEPPEYGWFCPQCSELPCQFVQWQEELERIVDLMNPDLANKQKMYQFYRHVSVAIIEPWARAIVSHFRPALNRA
jgi:hypothetical protein